MSDRSEPILGPADLGTTDEWDVSRRITHQRARYVVTAVSLLWLVLLGRLVQLQAINRETFLEESERQSQHAETIPARPGDIVDRHGRILATSLRTSSLYVVPNRIANPTAFAVKMAEALEIPVDSLLEKLTANSGRQFLWIRRRLGETQRQKIVELKLPFDQWGFREEFRREYPQGQLACHVLGLRDADGAGRGGIEQAEDDILHGHDGKRRLIRDALGHIVDSSDDVDHPPAPGGTVNLTLDCVVQLFTDRELEKAMAQWQPESACAVVMEVATGDILAMSSFPQFDPNQPASIPDDAWSNRAISEVFEPGSTFKPFVVAVGLDEGIINRDDQVNCEMGEYKMGRRVLHDHHRYGRLSLTDILVKSSNIGMAKIGERMGNALLYESARRFGFGQPTGIELPGELPGTVHPLQDWTSYSTGSIPMGHELTCTAIQLIAAHASLANAGETVKPHLTKRDESMRIDLGQVVSAETAQWLINGPMTEVVTRGTGQRAKQGSRRIFGKTGTAQAMAPGGGYEHGRYISSFICGAPIEKPRIMVLVVLRNSTADGEAFGGKVAAPAAGAILDQTLDYLDRGNDMP